MTHVQAFAGIHLDGEGSITQKEADYLSSLVAFRGPLRVVETGFGLGWSTFAFLSGNPECEVISFDIGSHKGVYEAKAIIDRLFPERHQLVIGDSKLTVPELLTRKNDFYLAYIDGGHDYETARADLINLAAQNRLVVIDDLEDVAWAQGVRQAWSELVTLEFLREVERNNDGPHIWATGIYY